MQFYCVKCKGKQSVSDDSVKVTRAKNKAKTLVAKADCPHCGITMCRFVAGGAKKSVKSRGAKKSRK